MILNSTLSVENFDVNGTILSDESSSALDVMA